MIRIEHLTKTYGNTTPLRDVSCEIRKGDVIAIIGPSGTGKSTLLRCLNLLEHPTSGSIWMEGTDICDPSCDIDMVRRRMGMVFQQFNLFGHLTVIENLMQAPCDLLGKSRQEAYDEGMRLLRMVGLAERALSYPDELSGGQQQRVAIARALAMDPHIILFDEPTSALDPTMVGEVQAVIRDLAQAGKTMMIVTHEMDFARAVGNRVFFMHDGGILEDGTPEQVFDHPQHEATRRFVRRLKVLELSVEGHDYDFIALVNEVDSYCKKNYMPRQLANHLQLAVEEAVVQVVVPSLDDPRVRVQVEYADKAGEITLVIWYNGPTRNVLQDADPLSLGALHSATTEVFHEHAQDGPYTNKLTLRVKA